MRKEYTRFGEELRILRTKRHQNQKEMADTLGVSKSFLSAVKIGKNAIPKEWIDIITNWYHLKPYHRQLLEDAARRSRTHIRINLKGYPIYKRDLAIAFEDTFDQIDDEMAEKIVNILLPDSVK